MNTTSQKLLILGAGESGIGAALLGKAKGWDVFVSDGGTIAAEFWKELADAAILLEEGGHSDARLEWADLVVKSPGIPESAPAVQTIRSAGVPLISEIEFAYRYKGAGKIIAITGSNGKSTTTKLVYHLLKTAGYSVSLTGNIGISLARQIATAPTDWYAVEISSFQLDDIQTFRPEIAALLNITPDHLDRYNYELSQYAAAKMRIFENQAAGDIAIVGAEDENIKVASAGKPFGAEVLYFSSKSTSQSAGWLTVDALHFQIAGGEISIPLSEFSLAGSHNAANALAAGLCTLAAGISEKDLRAGLQNFEGLEHRLESAGEIDGVKFLNDSKATNVDSVWYALESLRQPAVLILGGIDKGNDYSLIEELVCQKVKAIVCMGTDNAPIQKAFSHLGIPILETQSATEAVQKAFQNAVAGDAVLLSPACASFDLFKNYEDRGGQFKAAVQTLLLSKSPSTPKN